MTKKYTFDFLYSDARDEFSYYIESPSGIRIWLDKHNAREFVDELNYLLGSAKEIQ